MMRSVTVGVALAGLMLGCSDNPSGPGSPSGPGDPEPPAPSPFLVSDPRPATQVSGSATRLGASLAVSAATSRVYVSLPPGSFPDANVAAIQERRSGAGLTVAVGGGGFDPVAIAAEVGDTLDVTVQRGGTLLSSYRIPVHIEVSPMVVRTSPPANVRDVALNGLIVVVFSEPMDSASVVRAVTVTRDGVELPGRVEIPAGQGDDILRIDFIPDQPLEPLTTYRLRVGTGALDRGGEALEAAVVADFTTSALPADLTPPVVSIVSPAAGDSEAVGFATFRAVIQEDRGVVMVSWQLDDGSAKPPFESGVGTTGQDGQFITELDGRYNIPRSYFTTDRSLHAGDYTVRVSVEDAAGNIGVSAPVAMRFARPDTQSRIVVRTFSVIEFQKSNYWVYAPKLVVADKQGGDGLEMVGFEMLAIPGVTNPFLHSPRWARGLPVPAGDGVQLFHDLYYDYDVAYGSYERSSGGTATARLTYRDGTGHFYVATVRGPIVAGAAPTDYNGGCTHWTVDGIWPGDTTFCGF